MLECNFMYFSGSFHVKCNLIFLRMIQRRQRQQYVGIFMSLETGGLWMRMDTSGLLEELMTSLILLGNLRLINNKTLNLNNTDDSDVKLCLHVIEYN